VIGARYAHLPQQRWRCAQPGTIPATTLTPTHPNCAILPTLITASLSEAMVTEGMRCLSTVSPHQPVRFRLITSQIMLLYEAQTDEFY
jgi:hypothetical protein